MPRIPRRDAPGRFHHVINRAAGRQVLFADRQDFRYFTSLLVRAVRRGELVIQAYCLLSTHFHLLAASPDGRLSFAMMRIENTYARYRNRRSGGEGPVLRPRFRSKPVLSRLYWRILIRYIDHNPVKAGLCKHPFEYAYGSAKHYAGTRTPLWLDRSAVDRALAAALPKARNPNMAYATVFGSPLAEAELEIIERRLAHPGQAEDELDALYRSPPGHLAAWMTRMIRAAGGHSPWTPVAAPSAVLAALAEARRDAPPWKLQVTRKRHDGWAVLGAGLLHTLACVTTSDAGRLLACHRATAARRVALHREYMQSDSEYSRRAGIVGKDAIERTIPQRLPP